MHVLDKCKTNVKIPPFYLVVATHHHLGVKDNEEAEDDGPYTCKNQSCSPSLKHNTQCGWSLV